MSMLAPRSKAGSPARGVLLSGGRSLLRMPRAFENWLAWDPGWTEGGWRR